MNHHLRIHFEIEPLDILTSYKIVFRVLYSSCVKASIKKTLDHTTTEKAAATCDAYSFVYKRACHTKFSPWFKVSA